MARKFIYLLQGQAHLIKNFLKLQDADHRDVIFLTYDEPLEQAIFFPNSSWAEGRNKLCELAKRKGNYQYFIFCDDDVGFIRGGWDSFETALLKYRPSIGVPVVPKTRNGPFTAQPQQPFFVNDEQLIAIHRDVIRDNILVPYITEFDHIHFWAACHIQEVLIQNFYARFSLQFNEIQISNNQSTRYPSSDERIRRGFKALYGWLDKEFSGEYRDVSKNIDNHREELVQRISHNRRLAWLNKLALLRHSAKPGEVDRLLAADSELLRRYRQRGYWC